MKKGYKCDYCFEFSENKDEIQKHELKCCFNPKNRRCYTCIHKISSGSDMFDFYEECNLNMDMLAVEDEEIICESWEEE
jgi:pantothenate kinase